MDIGTATKYNNNAVMNNKLKKEGIFPFCKQLNGIMSQGYTTQNQHKVLIKDHHKITIGFILNIFLKPMITLI